MEPDVFQLDEAGHTPSPHPRQSSSTPGTSTPPHRVENDDIAVERRVVPLLEYSEDTCSICLDEYTREDPGAPTVCGHHFHLQCIMQWAQRSRECPLCFRSLQLEDEDMNSLLPFGEYISPAQRAAEQASLETWELERLLIRLATASQREHRHHRSSRHRSSGGSSGGGSSSRHRRQGSRGEASAPQPIRSSSGGGDSGGGDTAAAAAAAAWWSLPGDATNGPSSSSTTATTAAAAAKPTPDSSDRHEQLRPASAPAPGAAFSASWSPSTSGAEASTSSNGAAAAGAAGAAVDEGHVVSPRSRSGPLSLKGRLASLRLKDKLDKTARELKSLFSPGGGTGGPGSSSAGGGSSTHHSSRAG